MKRALMALVAAAALAAYIINRIGGISDREHDALLTDIFEEGTWGHDFFDEPVAQWVEDLDPAQRTAMESTLIGNMPPGPERDLVIDIMAQRGVFYGSHTAGDR